jgi:hypothetical protein
VSSKRRTVRRFMTSSANSTVDLPSSIPTAVCFPEFIVEAPVVWSLAASGRICGSRRCPVPAAWLDDNQRATRLIIVTFVSM